jgi:hypothetical protein
MPLGERAENADGAVLFEAAAEKQHRPGREQVVEEPRQRPLPVDLCGIAVAVMLGVFAVGQHTIGLRLVIAVQLPQHQHVDVQRLGDPARLGAPDDVLELLTRFFEHRFQHPIEVRRQHRTGRQRGQRAHRRIRQLALDRAGAERAADGVLERQRAERLLKILGGLFVLPLRQAGVDGRLDAGTLGPRAQEGPPFRKPERPGQAGADKRNQAGVAAQRREEIV